MANHRNRSAPMRAWGRGLALALLLWLALPVAAVASSTDDAYLKGVLTTIFEREWGWAHGSYRVQVTNGVATVYLSQEDAARRQELATRLPPIQGLKGVNAAVGEAPSGSTSAKIYSFLGLAPDTTPFPIGDLFWPLVADPKQPQFFVSYRLYDTSTDTVNSAAVGYGETFGFFRREGKRPGDGLQVGISGGLFAQFNLDAPSNDLVNADYTLGIPVTYRRGDWSARLRFYHQSSHLGDEFLLRAKPERVNLSFESLELLGSYRRGHWRVYGGGEYLVHREPADLKPAAAHGGLEYRGARPLWGRGYPIMGLDVKSWQEHGWSPDASLKGGLEFGARQPGQRRLKVMAEYYHGYAPHGQFYEDKLTYYGVGVYLGF